MKCKKPNYSKLLCAISYFQFFLVLGIYIYNSVHFLDTSAFMYIMPASAALVTAATSFYFWKSKAENLSKQRIRFYYLKLLLQEKLSPEDYREIEQELCNIDAIVDSKLNNMLYESVNRE